MVLNVYAGQSVPLDIAAPGSLQKGPLPTGERDLETNHPNSMKIITVVENEYLDAQKRT